MPILNAPHPLVPCYTPLGQLGYHGHHHAPLGQSKGTRPCHAPLGPIGTPGPHHTPLSQSGPCLTALGQSAPPGPFHAPLVPIGTDLASPCPLSPIGTRGLATYPSANQGHATLSWATQVPWAVLHPFAPIRLPRTPHAPMGQSRPTMPCHTPFDQSEPRGLATPYWANRPVTWLPYLRVIAL